MQGWPRVSSAAKFSVLDLASLNKVFIWTLAYSFTHSFRNSVSRGLQAVHHNNRERENMQHLPWIFSQIRVQCEKSCWEQTLPKHFCLRLCSLWDKCRNKDGIGQTHDSTQEQKIITVTPTTRRTTDIDILGDSYDLQSPEDFKKYIVRTDRGQTCSICQAFSHSSKSNVKKHIESRHFPNSFSYSCTHCATVVGTQMALDKHMATHKIQMMWKLWNIPFNNEKHFFLDVISST